MSGKRNKQRRKRRVEEIMANEPNVLLDKQVGLIRLNAAIEGMEAACMIVDQALSAVRESIGGAKAERKKLADEVEARRKAGTNGNAAAATDPPPEEGPAAA